MPIFFDFLSLPLKQLAAGCVLAVDVYVILKNSNK